MGKLKSFLELMRPRQWFKSFYIVFGAVPAIFLSPFITFMIPWLLFIGIINMILIQGVIYSINDIADMEKDKLHTKKKDRPIPSGHISVKEAKFFAIFLFLVALAMAWFMDFRIILIDIFLVALNLLYSLRPVRLKDKKYLDIFTTGLNFPLRVGVGWYLFEPLNQARFHFNYSVTSKDIVSESIQALFFNTPPRIIEFSSTFSTVTLSFVSMMVLTYFLAIFLLSLKRLGEKLWIKNADKTRTVLGKYSTSSLKAIALMSFVFVALGFFFLAFSLKLSLIFLTSYFMGLVWWYYRLAFRKDSPVKNPEEVFTKNKGFIVSGIIFLLLMLLLLII